MMCRGAATIFLETGNALAVVPMNKGSKVKATEKSRVFFKGIFLVVPIDQQIGAQSDSVCKL